jgi:hypothetical protein
MNTMLAQMEIPALPGDPKAWVTVVAGLLLTMIVGRFVQAFRGGAGIIDAGKAVLFGTNVPKPPTDDKPPTSTGKAGLYTWLLIGALALGMAGVVTGCKTAPQTVAYRAANGTTLTVETAIRTYNVFAAQGKTTVAQNQQVKAAYEKYQAAMLVVCDAGAIYAATSGTNAPAASLALQVAVQNSTASIADVVNLIQSFGVKL